MENQRKVKLCIIMRGVPGSGKSTVAQLLTNKDFIHSTDDYSYVNGVYKFNPMKLQENHEKNF